MVALEDVVRIFDLRGPSADLTLFTISADKTRITDLVKPQEEWTESTIRVLCTDREILWFDLRRPGDPFIRYKHRRDGDLSLSLSSAFSDGGELIVSAFRHLTDVCVKSAIQPCGPGNPQI